jgi:hypothetical protein
VAKGKNFIEEFLTIVGGCLINPANRRKEDIGTSCSDLVPGTALALMTLPFVIQYRVEARKLTIGPSQRIYLQASRPGLNKIPFQLVELGANHKSTSYLGHTLNGNKKAD